MDNQKRSTKDVILEKYEDRGWGEYNTEIDHIPSNISDEKSLPLPLTREEYHKFALLLGKICIEDRNPQLCDLYFDLKERATKGNHYFVTEDQEFWEFEETIFNIGTDANLRKENSVKKL